MPPDGVDVASSTSLARRGGGAPEVGIKPRILKHGYVRFLSLHDLDGRTRAATRCKELVRALEVDLGGADQLTTAQAQLVQRAAILGVQAEDFEARFALGQPVELTDYFTCVNVQRRVLATLGLERRSRDVSTPTLSQYLAARPVELDDEPDAAPAADGSPPVASNGWAAGLAAGSVEDAIGGETAHEEDGTS
jgi:hypothetical protein